MPVDACRGLTYRLFCLQHALNTGRLVELIEQRLASQYLPLEQQIARQQDALRQTLENAAANVPYYRDLIASLGAPADFATLDSFRHVPVLHRNTLVEQSGKFLSERAGPGMRYSSSSGTSGRPVRSGHDDAARHSAMAARARAMSWYGVTPWDRQGLIVSQKLTPQRKLVSTLIDRFVGRRRNASLTLDAPQAAAFARTLDRFHPAVILGQPSLMNCLLHGAVDSGIHVRSWGTRLLFANSEVLTAHVSDKLAGAFGCPVLNEYGCTEVGSMAHRCPAGSLHLNPEHALVELVDASGAPVPPGVPGDVLLTTLVERTMPLIRYAVGDVAVWADAPCPCGRQPGLRGLSHVEGRRAFVWRDAAGAVISSRNWLKQAQELLEKAGFWECQFMQSGPTQVELRVQPNTKIPDDLIARMTDCISRGIAQRVDVLARQNPVHRTNGGKLAIVCRPFSGISA